MAVVEVTNFPFVHETMIEGYYKTLNELRSGAFAAIQCDQSSHHDHEVNNACKYAMGLIKKELDGLKEQRKALYAELDAKYGVKGKDYIVTMDGSVHLINDRKTDESVDCGMVTNWRLLEDL